MRKLIVLLAIVLVGCAPRGTVRLVGLESINSIEVSGTGFDVDIVATIESSFKGKIKIDQAVFNVISGSQTLANVSLREPITILPSTTAQCTIPLRIRVGINTITQLAGVLSGLESMKIEGSAKGQMGLVKRKINFSHTLTERDRREIIQHLRI